MADLTKLQEFAADPAHPFGLTNPLTHAQVVVLAEYWLPEMRFHYDERFHPISLDEAFSMVESLFAALPPAAQEQWRVPAFVRTSASSGEVRTFVPPVVHVPDGAVPVGNQFRPVVRVLNDGTAARDALSLPEVGTEAVVTHGASFTRSNQFFGAEDLLIGGNSAGPGNPFVPRADEPFPASPTGRRPHITVMAALLNLVDLLKYELHVSADADYPSDGLRRGFDITGRLLRPASPQPPLLSAQAKRAFLLAMIAAHESGGSTPTVPAGWILDRVAWDAVTRFAFLEFYFFYAYNDWERYQTALFDNEHEGDDEGCCLVFDRSVINLVAGSGDPDALKRVVPHSIITSVHEEWQDADVIKFIPTPAPNPANPLARDVVGFTVYVAGGSHATYLTTGDHDLVDFGDYWGWSFETLPDVVVVVLSPVVLVVAIILSIIEHFVDTEDFTSDEGVHGVPEGALDEHPTGVPVRVIVLPMSADTHIYRPGLPADLELLRLRAFAGKWGGHDGLVDKSPPFAPKTGRYFRKLLDAL